MNAKQKEQTIEEIKKLLEENNGIVKAEKLYPLGLTYKSIQGLVKAGILDHVKSGYYSMGYEEKPQEEIILGLFPDGILYIEKRPYEWSIAISKNTSKSRFRMEYPVVKPYYIEPEVMELGVTAIPFAGGEMKIYEKERLICDCLKYEERLEREDLKKALLAFINEPKKDIAKLMEYARARKVVAKIQSRIGVWL